MKTIYCPYCYRPLPDYTDLRREIIQAEPEEAGRGFCVSCNCGASVRISPTWQTTIEHAPRRTRPGLIPWGRLMQQGYTTGQIAEIVKAQQDTVNLKGERINK